MGYAPFHAHGPQHRPVPRYPNPLERSGPTPICMVWRDREWPGKSRCVWMTRSGLDDSGGPPLQYSDATRLMGLPHMTTLGWCQGGQYGSMGRQSYGSPMEGMPLGVGDHTQTGQVTAPSGAVLPVLLVRTPTLWFHQSSRGLPLGEAEDLEAQAWADRGRGGAERTGRKNWQKKEQI